MQALFEMSEGRETLSKIVNEFPPESPHWNEAQNRFQFIDRLLTECLGWDKPDVEVESRDESGGIADYILGGNKAVLEAKKEALLWEILPKTKPRNLYKLRSQADASKEFDKAVHQIIPYCAVRGAPLAIVCNGPQLAIFLPFAYGKPPLEGFCYIFDGFEAYIREFPLLWSLLSPEGIGENRAYRRLSDRHNVRIPAKASDHIPEPRQFRYRKQIQEELRQLGSFLLEEIEDNPDLRAEFYKECYVAIEANNRHLLLSKQVISERYARVPTEGERPSAIDHMAKSGSLGEQAFAAAGSRPIVVIGDVGVGKSSFFENLYLNIPEKEKEKTIYLKIDLGTSATLSDDVKSYVISQIPDLLYDQYGIDIEDADFVESIYFRQLERFEKSLEGRAKDQEPQAYKIARRKLLLEKVNDRGNHIKHSLSQLAKGRNNRVVLVMDNADQRTFEVQQEAFLVSQEFAAMRTVNVFVSLRPSTFYLSKMSGALSAYQNKILTISPPPADEVIKRRLLFALRVAEGNAAHGAIEGIRLNLGSIVIFLRALLRSIRKNQRIQQFLSNITGGNTKAVIELVTSFVGSPNVEAAKIIRIEEFEGNYLVPYHEFTKHALLGQYTYYNAESSLVACNVFDVSASDPREHFLKCLVVAFCASSSGARDNDGFFSGHDIAREMSVLGFGENQIAAALIILAQKKLLETPYSHYRELSVEESIDPRTFSYRATSVGIYHIRFWIGEFSYLDAMSTDTPIFDANTREFVAKRAASVEIEPRLRKAESFRQYLAGIWRSAEFGVSYFDFESVLQLRQEEFDRVHSVIGRKQEKAATNHLS